jgi:tripartite-type tricarboxylate transporter receptor subunit TctC
MQMRILLTIAALAALAPVAVSTADAQSNYPTRQIRLIVPYPAGGATDVVGRIVAEKMADTLGQTIYVENRAGAGTMIGANVVARSEPDGYNILIGDTGTYSFNPTLYGDRLSYDPAKDFAPVCRTGRVPLILVFNPKSLQISSVKDLIERARKEPGKINFGAPGPGSPIHLALELFKQRVGIQLTAVPYKGGADALTDLLGGRIELLFIDAATGLPQIKSGAFKALAVGSGERIAALPDVPTMAEAGVPNFEAWAWNGLAVRAGTAPQVIGKLNDACQKALADPALKQRFADLAVEPAPTTAEGFGDFIKSETAKWRDVITAAGVSIK